MDFARQQRDPKRHVIGLSAVILFHVLVIYGLMTGLAQKAVEVIKKPISATIVEEIKKPPPPPPPPPKKIIEQPKVAQPPPQPYVPPPDIPPPPQPQVEAPVIQSTPVPPPPVPYVIAPPPPPVVVAPPAPPKPAIQQAAVTCPNQEKPTFPREAIRRGVEKGEVAATLSIDEKGNVTSVDITSSIPPGVFDRAVTEVLGSWKCVGQGEKIKARAIISFRLE